MAKDKKQIKDFRQALQQNLEGLRGADIENTKKALRQPRKSNDTIRESVRIRRDLLEKYNKLALHHKLDEQQFIEVALNFFLSLEETWFGEKVLED